MGSAASSQLGRNARVSWSRKNWATRPKLYATVCRDCRTSSNTARELPDL